jgi:hypothetical protein
MTRFGLKVLSKGSYLNDELIYIYHSTATLMALLLVKLKTCIILSIKFCLSIYM